jgi:hypothetical protein
MLLPYVPPAFTIQSLLFCAQGVFLFLIIGQTAMISLNSINPLVLTMKMACVPCKVSTKFLNKI